MKKVLLAVVVVALLGACPVPVYRMQNPVSGKHTLVAGIEYMLSLQEQGWENEGIAFYAYSDYTPELVPVFHLYNRLTGDHFFTADASERDAVLYSSGAWSYWGVAFFAYPARLKKPGSVAVHRFWINAVAGHLYTSSQAEVNALKYEGNIYEGVAFRALPFYGSYKVLGVFMRRPQDVSLKRALEDFDWVTKARHQIAMVSLGWNEEQLGFARSVVTQVVSAGKYPLILWNPWKVSLMEIRMGYYDCYIRKFAEVLREVSVPVLLAFAPYPNDPDTPWFSLNNPQDFVEAFRRVRSLFYRAGAMNVFFVWMLDVKDAGLADVLYPNEGSVDIVGIRALSFEEPFEEYFTSLKTALSREVGLHPEKPVILEVAKATNGNPLGKAQFIKALYRELAKEPSVCAVVYFNDFMGSEPKFPDFRVTRTAYWRTVPIDPSVVDGYSFAASFFMSP